MLNSVVPRRGVVLAFDLVAVRVACEIAAYLVTIVGFAAGAIATIKAWPHFKARAKLIQERDDAIHEASVGRARLAAMNLGAAGFENTVQMLVTRVEGLERTIKEQRVEISRMSLQLAAFTQYTVDLLSHPGLPPPPLPPELHGDVLEALRLRGVLLDEGVIG